MDSLYSSPAAKSGLDAIVPLNVAPVVKEPKRKKGPAAPKQIKPKKTPNVQPPEHKIPYSNLIPVPRVRAVAHFDYDNAEAEAIEAAAKLSGLKLEYVMDAIESSEEYSEKLKELRKTEAGKKWISDQRKIDTERREAFRKIFELWLKADPVGREQKKLIKACRPTEQVSDKVFSVIGSTISQAARGLFRSALRVSRKEGSNMIYARHLQAACIAGLESESDAYPLKRIFEDLVVQYADEIVKDEADAKRKKSEEEEEEDDEEGINIEQLLMTSLKKLLADDIKLVEAHLISESQRLNPTWSLEEHKAKQGLQKLKFKNHFRTLLSVVLCEFVTTLYDSMTGICRIQSESDGVVKTDINDLLSAVYCMICSHYEDRKVCFDGYREFTNNAIADFEADLKFRTECNVHIYAEEKKMTVDEVLTKRETRRREAILKKSKAQTWDEYVKEKNQREANLAAKREANKKVLEAETAAKLKEKEAKLVTLMATYQTAKDTFLTNFNGSLTIEFPTLVSSTVTIN